MAEVNVADNYPWTTTQGSYKTEAPRVYATSYSINNNAILEAVKTYYSAAGAALGVSTSVDSFYTNMHKGATVRDRYVFPFFNDEVRSLNNSWGDSYITSTNGSNTGITFGKTLKDLADTALTLMTQVAAFSEESPGALFEPPKFYQYSQDEGPVTVSFVLINTTEVGHDANYKLVKDLIVANRFERKEGSPFLVTPPNLWKVIVPGYRYIRWAACGVTVSLLGTRRMVQGNIIPEGYNISLTFTPLYTEPNNYANKY